MTANPVLVESTRGGVVETRHRGAIAVCDADGGVVWSAGKIDDLVFPRSAAKLVQALPLVESGAADRYGLTDRELALACASHSSEEDHVATAKSMLEKAGLSESNLECGTHWPLFNHKHLIDFAGAGKKPNQLHNNCSGKHAGFLCACAHQGIETEGYVGRDHAIQRQVKAALEDLTGTQIGEAQCGVDGCSIPTYAVPLRSLAHGFAKAATGHGLGKDRAVAARRLMAACMEHPWYVAGTKRFCTEVMEAGEGCIFAKTGADGVYAAAIPEMGLGLAIKCTDGSGPATEIMLASALARLFDEADARYEQLQAMTSRRIRNWNGTEVGEMRAVYKPD
ncbi:asparaginase [Oricola cellulosilytica]|uniref:Asparaginase n=1 Tax=Oricola cellulosilytica TaxID=1429082 RepID=A0A4R0PCP4_9HYPH|nr:asparaginase [Oricola cellulosilytica]TCD14069.1 asparaginase [Oricola cellulosilytica]